MTDQPNGNSNYLHGALKGSPILLIEAAITNYFAKQFGDVASLVCVLLASATICVLFMFGSKIEKVLEGYKVVLSLFVLLALSIICAGCALYSLGAFSGAWLVGAPVNQQTESTAIPPTQGTADAVSSATLVASLRDEIRHWKDRATNADNRVRELEARISILTEPTTPVFSTFPVLNRNLSLSQAQSLVDGLDELKFLFLNTKNIRDDLNIVFKQPSRADPKPIALVERIATLHKMVGDLNSFAIPIQSKLNNLQSLRPELAKLINSPPSNSEVPSIGIAESVVQSIQEYISEYDSLTVTPEFAPEVVQRRILAARDSKIKKSLELFLNWTGEIANHRVDALQKEADKYLQK